MYEISVAVFSTALKTVDMSDFGELTEEEIVALLGYSGSVESGLNPTNREIALEVNRYVPMYLFEHYKQMISTIDPETAKCLEPNKLDFEHVISLSPRVLQRVLNSVDPMIVQLAISDLPIERKTTLRDLLSNRNRADYDSFHSTPAPDELAEAKSQVLEPISRYLAEVGFLLERG